ncbi:hypothetical protein H2203_008291 [Taxawa tesnikishii (nom. ined.)]|nr:hypothetical protein H2203_008291 [Dothideales sp. JES 119]
MADTMDIDMDIDLTEDPETARMMEEEMARNYDNPTITEPIPVADDVPAAYKDDFEKNIPTPNKVHLRGVDSLTTDHIKQFATEHYPSDYFQRVEWVDDASANLVYTSNEAAAEALQQLSAENPINMSSVEVRRAKQLSSHPDVELFVRQATIGDVKVRGAREKSRFYLMNPEHDPGERRRRYDDRYQRRGPGYGRHDERGPKRRPHEDARPFDESMYDDAPVSREPSDQPRRASYASYSSEEQRHKPARHTDNDLLPAKSHGRLRDRSASPIRDGDGRFGFEEDQPRRKTARQRSRTPPPRYRERDNSSTKELFPSKPAGGASNLDALGNAGVELFPNRSSPPKRSRELFPNKTPKSNHRRSDALNADETADLFARRDGGDLASRIAGGPAAGSRSLADRISNPNPSSRSRNEEQGFSIRGSSQRVEEETPGFSIRGASGVVNPVVKELFPLKAGNSGKELFADRIKRDRAQRRRAEDLF